MFDPITNFIEHSIESPEQEYPIWREIGIIALIALPILLYIYG